MIDARPLTRVTFARSKTLTLRVRRVEMIDPKKIPYSLPTICDVIPGLSEEALSGGELMIADDDWRQAEFISAELAREADEEIAKIRLIHENAATSYGWREIHVRKPEPPIVCQLTLAELAAALDVSPQPAGVAYYGARSRIADGYAFTLDGGLAIDGVAPGGAVGVIAVGQFPAADLPPATIARFQTLARDLRLEWVHWPRCIRTGPDDPMFLRCG